MPKIQAQQSEKKIVLLGLSWVFSPLVDGIMSYAQEHDWVVRLFNLITTPVDEMVSYASQIKYDGVLTQCFGEEITDAILGLKAPTVDICWRQPNPQFPNVSPDDVAVGRMAGEHLVAKGFEHFAFYGASTIGCYNDRLQGFREGTASKAKSFIVIDNQGSGFLDSSNFLKHFASEVAYLPKPLGLMGLHDPAATVALDACLTGGVPVPDQIAIVGCDNAAYICEQAAVPLSSVNPDFNRVGYEAAQLLDRMMDGESVPNELFTVPPKGIIERESTNILAISHSGVARAVGLILRAYNDSRLTIKQVVAASGMSRRPLELAFTQHLDTTIGEFLRNTRLEHAQRLLRETSDQIKDIVAASGFRNVQQFEHNMRRATGLTPTEWRKQNSP